MLSYRGQYRVIFETDKSGKACEFTYIPCRIRKGTNISRHNENTLSVYIPGIQTVNRLQKEYPEIFKPFQIGDKEANLLFSESMMAAATEILHPYVLGKNRSPRPKRKVTISEERKQRLSEKMKQLHRDKKFIGAN